MTSTIIMAALWSFYLLSLAYMAAANPLPAPTPPPLPEPSISPLGDDCTHTLTSYYRGFTGDWAPTKTRTRYTATETTRQSIDCSGCAQLKIYKTISPFYGGIGPVEHVVWVTASVPTTVTQTVCAVPSAIRKPGKQAIPRAPKLSEPPRAKREDPKPLVGCTSTVTATVLPWWVGGSSNDGTKTIHTATQTAFEKVECNGCDLEFSVEQSFPRGSGVGPVVKYWNTVTATTPATITSTICDIPSLTVRKVARELPEEEVKAREEPEPPVFMPGGKADDPSNCTITKTVAIRPTWGPTRTIWTQIDTTISSLDCGATCRHVAIKTVDFLHPGPVVIFTTTVTATEPTFRTRFACMANATTTTESETVQPSSLPMETSL
jgi:hypothetical protein